MNKLWPENKMCSVDSTVSFLCLCAVCPVFGPPPQVRLFQARVELIYYVKEEKLVIRL